MSVIRQLEEVFPNISVNFLKDICEAYGEEQLDINILVDLVLSYEFPPVKECVPNVTQAVPDSYINNKTAENHSHKTNIDFVQDKQNNEQPENVIERSELLHNSNESIISVNPIMSNFDHLETENNYSCEQIILNSYDGNCFEYTLEDTFLIHHYNLAQKEGVLNTSNKDVDTENIVTEKFDISEDLTENNISCNQNIEQHIKNTTSNIHQSGNTSATKCNRRPHFRSCKIKYNELNATIKQKPNKESSDKNIKNLNQNMPLFECRCTQKEEHEEEKKISSDNVSQFESLESKYVLLSKILPNADPDYLLSKSENITNQEDLLIFISQSLDKENCSSDVSNKCVKKITMDKFQCTVDTFLKEIPDPITEFSSNLYTRTDYEGNAEAYLLFRYPSFVRKLVKDYLQSHNYNLTTICAELETTGFEASHNNLDQLEMHHPPSISFHQEIWFIEHRTEIQNFLDSAVEAYKLEEELNRPVTPPYVEEVFECEICSDEISEYAELGTCNVPRGAHLFCKSCIKRSIEIQLGEGSITFPCLANCEGFIDLQTVKELLSPDTFAVLMNKIQEEEIRSANIPRIETCPFCHYAYEPETFDDLFRCLNPFCEKISCRVCRKEDHSPEICDIFQNENEETARHFIENKMTEALVRNCYKCGKSFVKEEGCNKMTCKCGALMCYLCRQPVTDYTHFNGPGGDNYDRCELFSEEETLHGKPVAVSARQAFDELVANNPGLKLDASKIIPE